MNRSMPPKLRWSILKRDGFRCAYCGRTAAEGVRLEVDHIVSWADGGRDQPANLTTACNDCNAGKSAESLPSIRFVFQPGDKCPTRLLVAEIGLQMGVKSYREAWRIVAASCERIGSTPPPRDRSDGQFWTLAVADVEAWQASLPQQEYVEADPTIDLRNPRARKRESRRDPNP